MAHKLHFAAGNIGNIHVVSGWAEFFQLFTSEDINGDKMHLSVPVFAGLRGGHVHDLAGAVLDHNEAVLAQGRALHRKCSRCTSIGAIESVLML